MAELPDAQIHTEPPAQATSDDTDISAASLNHLNNADCVLSGSQQLLPHVL